MKKITVELREELFEMLSKYSIDRKQSIQQIVSALIEKFAYSKHIMVEEEQLKAGYESCAEINLDWANL